MRLRRAIGLVRWRLLRAALSLVAPRRLSSARIAWLRSRGARIGEGCAIHTESFLDEPYLVEIGDGVGVAPGACFLTHDGSVAQVRRPGAAIFGRISVGSGSFIGVNAILLPGATIGRGCIVGAGSVVGGEIPDGSVVAGNPGRVVMTVAMAEQLAARRRHRIDLDGVPEGEVERVIRGHFGLTPGGAA